ncbi:DNA-3-methyladenine glycosylase I [Alteromonas sp. KUL42]|uniref:DNA-3-methyladenine glycosylase I n=1 Tax=Alteromonas sp. KUL42 TaxID=2480797 RepID=UPI0010355F83|nr:DNA-3-methyladenine glycosylase I [Alteromonas sp. KUL42]TAP32006.1 DNA-3-methyladenine glycosylase I [Alteromonas sp. KUL42]GEA08985.1 DNA-3-methyladenine glycosylase I [Alteromonas sp. KUL42]
MVPDQLNRCGWVGNDPIYQAYHDNEWGIPETNSQALFAKLCLDGQQAGLSWITILKKQQNYENAFHQFDPVKIVEMTEDDISRLMQNKGIVRNKLKIESIIRNAKGFLEIEKSQPFSEYIWQFTQGKTTVNQWQHYTEAPTSTEASKAMSKALKKYGFNFVGETICYAFMQAVGMVNDHEVGCHCYEKACKAAIK